MKTEITIRLTGLAIILILSISEIKARDTTIVALDTTPVALDTTPVPTPAVAPAVAPAPAPSPAPAATPEAKPEKAKKEGFNSKTRFGIRVGGILSNQDYESSTFTEGAESKIGGDLAILCAIPIGGGFFMLQPELHWMQKGYQIDDVDLLGNVTSTLNYLELALLARVNVGGSLRVFAFAGPSIGYLLSGTYEDDTQSLDPTDYLDDTEISAHIGIGAGIGTFELDVRYMAGLSDISDSDELTDVKNSSVGVGITLKF